MASFYTSSAHARLSFLFALLATTTICHAATVPFEKRFSVPPIGPIIPLQADPGLYPAVPAKWIRARDPISGNIRDIGYRVSESGLAIYDGDLVYGTEAQLLAARVSKRAEQESSASVRNVEPRSYSVDWAFPNGVISYYFWTAADKATKSSVVATAAGRWYIVAPYLKFKDLGVWHPGLDTTLAINISTSDTGCYTSHSAIWEKGSGRPFYMNLNKTRCSTDQATHESGHVLGLLHEHTRPDRDAHVSYQCANLAPLCSNNAVMAPGANCCNNLNPLCCAYASQFQIDSSSYDYRDAYDLKSVMQYPATGFALPGKSTLMNVNANEPVLPQFNGAPSPSAQDANKNCKIYKSLCPKAIDCINRGCSKKCTSPISTCFGSAACGSTTAPAPPCCDAFAVKECKDHNTACSTDCGFLL